MNQPLQSARPVAKTSQDDTQNVKSDKSNRLFSVLKNPRGVGAQNAGAPTKPTQPVPGQQTRPQTAPVPVAVETNTANESGENTTSGVKSRGRKRNRGKSARVDAEEVPTKTASSPSQVVRGGANPLPSEPMDVADGGVDIEKASFMTNHEFNSLPISAQSKRALLERMRIRFMTQVQHESLPEILKGHDVLVKAKTGTGKTLAFLVPSIEVLIKERTRAKQVSMPQPRVLVLSPTRELAQQIVAEATALCSFHNIGCVLLVGGTNMNSDVKALNKQGEGQNDIIVATPGRMLAHLKETPGFAEQVKGVKVYIMDEADRLLDMGFKRDIDQITAFLNQRDAARLGPRQTLLFSATVAPEIRDIARHTLLPGYKSIDTVGEEVEQTHAHVPQRVMCAPLDQQLRVIVQLLEQHQQANPSGYKIILFFATARQTGYYASVLNQIGMPTLEMHSRKSQGHRTKVAEQFRVGKNVMMASSDVSARGMDYPDVTFVLQVGMTDRDQYIHRLGRTARAGKAGTGLLLLAPFEYEYVTRRELRDLPLQPVTLEEGLPKSASPLVNRAIATVRELAARELESEVEAAFGEDSERDGAKMAWQAWLGYYNSHVKKLNMTKEELVAKSAEYAATIGLPQIPALQKKTIGKMGLQGVAGLRVEANKPQQQQGRNGGGGGGRGAPQPAASTAPARPATAPAPAPAAASGGRAGGGGSAGFQSARQDARAHGASQQGAMGGRGQR